jgi:DNA polymerase III subunit epsilon
VKALGDLDTCFPSGRHYPGIAHLLRVAAAGLVDEFSGDVQLSEVTFVCIDTETTGRDPNVDRVVEIACVRWVNGAVSERKTWLVNPGRPIPEEARAIHGIDDDAVRDAPKFEGVMAEVLVALEGAVPVAYNAEFDRDFLHAELTRVGHADSKAAPAVRKGVEWIDPLVWARALFREERSNSLGEVCERLGIVLDKAHRAENDAEAAMSVLHTLAKDPRVPRTYAAFVQEQRRLGREIEEERLKWRGRA